MKNLTTPLANSIESLITTMRETRIAIYTEANARKTALAKAIADMNEANEVMNDYVNTMNMLSEAADEFGADMNVSVHNVSWMLADMDVFTAPVEDFDGYCDQCGKEMTRNEDQYMDDDHDGFVCADCDKINHPEAEAGEQMTILNEEEA